MEKSHNDVLEFTPKQTEAFECVQSEEYDFILYGGAIRGGKSYWLLSTFLVLCQVFPRSRWVIIRENNERIRKNTIPSFSKIKKRGQLRQSPYEYTHHNGSVILFMGENYDRDKDLDAFKGLEANGFGFEEINECQQQTFYKAFERAGSWIIPDTEIQPKPIIMATCNPTFGWVKDLIYKPFKSGTLNPRWKYIPAKITDNPHLPQAYKDNLKNLPRFEYMVFVEGDWDVQLKVGGEFYKCFEIEKHVAICRYDPDLPLHISWDDNVNPYLPAGIFQIKGKMVSMIDEVAGINPGNTISAVCGEIVRRYHQHRSGVFIYGDATAKKEDTKMEKGHNFYTIILDKLAVLRPVLRVLKSNPSVAMRGQWLNAVFEKNDGDIFVLFNEKCTNAINDLIAVKEAPDGSKNKEMDTDPKTKVRFQKFGHFSDLFDYLMVAAFPNEYAAYQRPGQEDYRKTMGRNVQQASHRL